MNLKNFTLLAACVLALTARAGEITGSVSVLNARGRPLSVGKGEVVIFIDGLRGRFSQAAIEKIYQMDTLNKEYDPQLMVIPRGGTVTFTNFDPILHNVFSVSGKNRFDAGLFRENEVSRHTFLHTGLVRIYCNVHHSMNALIFVADNPYFVYADGEGRFRLENLPAGEYTIKALHRVAGDTQSPVVVEATGESRIDLELQAARKRLKRHMDKDGKPYRRRKDNRY